jgi:Transposase DDE domain
MQLISPLEDGGWAEAEAKLAADIDLAATARETKAFIRPRGVRSAATLLRLAMAYGVSGYSLRATVAWAAEAGIADITDVSLLDRLRNAANWLELIWQRKLAAQVAPIAMPGLGLAVRLIDATTISSPRTKTTEWRLHMDYCPLEGRFGSAVLTDGRTSEGFHLFEARPGELLVGDRGYAKAGGLAKVRNAGGHFLVRLGWRSVALLDAEGADFSILETIAGLPPGQISTFDVQLAESAKRRRPVCKARLIFAPLPEEAGLRAREKAEYKSKRQGRSILPEGAEAANWLILLTTVPDENAEPHQLVALYRLRWQIELAFKRLKSILNIDEILAKDAELARSWLSANLIAALLADDIDMASDSPPCAPC